MSVEYRKTYVWVLSTEQVMEKIGDIIKGMVTDKRGGE